MRPLSLLLICLFLWPAVAFAQDQVLPDVGLGAPRTTFAYAVAKPMALAQMLGFKDGKFAWEAELAESITQTQWRVKDVEASVKAIQQREEEYPDELKHEQDFLARTRADLKSQQGMAELVVQLREPFTKARRVDLCIVDWSIGWPTKVYFDIQLADGENIDLATDSIKELLSVADLDLSGIPAKRFAGEALPAPITTFNYKGHFYLAISDEVAGNLAQGLTAPRMDGESLAESSRFQRWYNEREDNDVMLWINAIELRRIIESTEGLLPFGNKAQLQEIDKEIGLRHWDLLVIGINHDVEAAKIDLTLRIKTRHEVPLFTAMAADNKGLELVNMLPESLPVLGFGNFAKPTELWQAYLPLLKNFFQAQQDRQDARDAPDKDDARGDFHGDQDERQEKPLAEAKSNFERFLENINEALAPSGKTFDETLKLASGRLAFGVAPQIDSGKPELDHAEATFVVFGTEDQAESEAALEKFILAHVEAKDYAAQLVIEGEHKRYFFNGTWLAFHRGQLFIAIGGTKQAGLKMLGSLLATPQRAATKTLKAGTAGLFLDYQAHLAALELANKTRRERLGREITFEVPDDLAARFPKGMSFTLGLDVKPTEFKLSLSVTGVFTDQRIFQQLALTPDKRGEIIADSLERIYRKLSEIESNGGVLTKNAEGLVDLGIFRGYLQNPYDRRYQGTPDLFYYPYEDGEWQAGYGPRDQANIEILKANAERDFISYTLAPSNGRKIRNMGGRILLYQTEAESYGGRFVLYGSGDIGWVHASQWQKALALMEADKQIPYSFEADDAHAGGAEDGGNKQDNGDDKTQRIDTNDTDQKIALAIIKLYNLGIRKAPATYMLHDNPNVGQSLTYANTNTKSQETRLSTYAVTRVDAEAKTAVVEMSFHEGYVLSLLVSTVAEEALQGKRVLKAWIGLREGHAFSAKVEALAQAPAPAANNTPPAAEPAATTSNFKALTFAGKAYDGIKTEITYPATPALNRTTWTSKDAWFNGLLKYETATNTTELRASSEKAVSHLNYAPDAFVVKAKAAPSEKKE